MEFKVFQKPRINKPFSFSSSAEVYQKIKGYQKADREMFLILFLNSKNVITNIETHTIGSVNSCGVYPQQILRSALINNASAFICVHNHPSGDPDPSSDDKEITKKIMFGSYILDIRFLDHIILGDTGYFSFADQGLIEDYEIEAKENIKS